MPTNNDWGLVQINNFNNTYYRFDMKNDNPSLDTSYFADQLKKTDEKHRSLSPESDFYKQIQQLLNEYVKRCENE